MLEPTPSDLTAELDRRFAERRQEDRERHRTIISLAAVLITVTVALISGAVAWATSNAHLSELDARKVDKIVQVQTDAAQDARIAGIRTDQVAQRELLLNIKAVVDSTNLRVRQMACDGKAPSCR